jgi:DUF1009 family protein
VTAAPAVLGIIAGCGNLPLRLADACANVGRKFLLLGLEGYADKAIEAYPHAWSALGTFDRTLKLLKGAGCAEVVFAGVVRRPDFTKVKLDWHGARLLPKIVQAAARGDNSLLAAILAEFEKKGFRVVGAEEIFAGLLAKPRVLTRVGPSARDQRDIARGVETVRALGRLDVGQGAVVCEGLVLAVEAAEGTDKMLERVAALPPEIRGSAAARRGVLVKLPKPAQERRIDLPTIGVATIESAAAAGLAGIAVEAGAALIIDEPAAVARADALGIFVAGVTLAPQAAS